MQKLQWSRELADGILALLKTTEVDQQLIDTLIKIVHQAIQNVKWQNQKSMLEKSLEQLHKIHDLEEVDKESDEAIEHILDDII